MTKATNGYSPMPPLEPNLRFSMFPSRLHASKREQRRPGTQQLAQLHCLQQSQELDSLPETPGETFSCQYNRHFRRGSSHTGPVVSTMPLYCMPVSSEDIAVEISCRVTTYHCAQTIQGKGSHMRCRDCCKSTSIHHSGSTLRAIAFMI